MIFTFDLESVLAGPVRSDEEDESGMEDIESNEDSFDDQNPEVREPYRPQSNSLKMLI